jgi:hypothetical protein
MVLDLAELMLKSKRAFSIKELIFAIVIIFLFTIFLPVDDIEGEVQNFSDTKNLKECIKDIKKSFLLRGIENTNSSSCDEVYCFGIDLGKSLSDGVIKIYEKDDANSYCYDIGGAFDMAEEEGLIDIDTKSKEYKFKAKKTSSWR